MTPAMNSLAGQCNPGKRADGQPMSSACRADTRLISGFLTSHRPARCRPCFALAPTRAAISASDAAAPAAIASTCSASDQARTTSTTHDCHRRQPCSLRAHVVMSCAPVIQALRDLGASAPLEQLMSRAASLRDSGHRVITFSPKVRCVMDPCCQHEMACTSCTMLVLSSIAIDHAIGTAFQIPTVSIQRTFQSQRRALTLRAYELCRCSCHLRGYAGTHADTARLRSLRVPAGGAT